jgi:hypothetical protein
VQLVLMSNPVEYVRELIAVVRTSRSGGRIGRAGIHLPPISIIVQKYVHHISSFNLILCSNIYSETWTSIKLLFTQLHVIDFTYLLIYHDIHVN